MSCKALSSLLAVDIRTPKMSEGVLSHTITSRMECRLPGPTRPNPDCGRPALLPIARRWSLVHCLGLEGMWSLHFLNMLPRSTTPLGHTMPRSPTTVPWATPSTFLAPCLDPALSTTPMWVVLFWLHLLRLLVASADPNSLNPRPSRGL